MSLMTKTTLTAGAVALSAMFAVTQANAELRGWNIHVPDYPGSVAMDKFTDLVAEKTDGRVQGKTYHSGVLGSQPDAINQLLIGGIDFAVFNMGPLGPVVPEANVASLPFIFKDMDHMHRVMDGPFGDKMSAAMEKKGMVALSWYDSGARSFYNTQRAITQPEDLLGLKFRVMNNELFVGMVEALGGNATPMAFSEVFTSLKTGVIDGAENNWPSYESTNHYEVAGFYSGSQHLILPECLCISKASWDKLSSEDQASVKKAAEESAVLQRKLWAERADKSRDIVTSAGVAYNEITDKSAFQAAMGPVYEKAVAQNPVLAELIADIQAVD